MSQITGIVVSVTKSKQIPKRGGGTYEGWELVYKDTSTDEIKTIQKPSQSLKQVPGLSDALSELTAGDHFVCTQEKVGQYLNVTGLSKGEMATPLPSRKEWAGKASTANRDFETKEERAIRQKLIVAQSSITAAVETLKNGKTALDKEHVKELAQEYFDWVFTKGQG